MTRRLGVMLGAVLASALALTGCGTSSGTSAHTTAKTAAASSKPNFVFVLTDDLSWNLVSHMPHVQALESTGTTFKHYYVVDSLCCPSRTAIFTGEFPHDDGVFTNTGSDGGYGAFMAHKDQTRSFAVALHGAGYDTAMMGKYLNGYQPATDPIPPGWDEWDVAGNGYPEFNYDLNQDGKLVHYGSAPGDYLTDVLSGKATSFINTASSAHKPFFLEVATFAPHAPYTPAPRYASAFPGAVYPKTPAYDVLPASPPSWLASRAPLTAAEKKTIATAWRKRLEADLSVDDMIGNLEKELAAKGVLKNTYFIFSSDNGYHMGEYRLDPGKQTAFDTDINVPLIVRGPGVTAGRSANQLVSNIDLNPTIRTLAGLTVPSTVDGHSLAAIWHGQSPAGWRQAILIEHHGPDSTASNPSDPDAQVAASGTPPSYEAIRTANALYVVYTATGEQEYYNTLKSPNELDNIASQGVPADLVTALKALENCHTGAACWAAAHLTG